MPEPEREVVSPLERLSVRLLPRPHGLASSQFQKLFVTCCARAKNLLPPPRSKGTVVRPNVGAVCARHHTPGGEPDGIRLCGLQGLRPSSRTFIDFYKNIYQGEEVSHIGHTFVVLVDILAYVFGLT